MLSHLCHTSSRLNSYCIFQFYNLPQLHSPFQTTPTFIYNPHPHPPINILVPAARIRPPTHDNNNQGRTEPRTLIRRDPESKTQRKHAPGVAYAHQEVFRTTDLADLEQEQESRLDEPVTPRHSNRHLLTLRARLTKPRPRLTHLRLARLRL